MSDFSGAYMPMKIFRAFAHGKLAGKACKKKFLKTVIHVTTIIFTGRGVAKSVLMYSSVFATPPSKNDSRHVQGIGPRIGMVLT